MTETNAGDVLQFLEEELPAMKTSLALLEAGLETAKSYSKQNSRSLRGSNNTPGLVAEVRSLIEWKKNVKSWYILLIGAALSAIVVGGINIILELGSRSVVP